MPPDEPENDLLLLPPALTEHLARHGGLPDRIERLRGGLSTARVDRLHWSNRTRILKSGVKPAELHFYQFIAPVLRREAIPLPDVDFLLDGWVLMEDIATPLPRERWQGDAEIAAILARLHRVPVEKISPMPPGMGYLPVWEEALNAKALANFDDMSRQSLRPRLEVLRRNSQHLFAPNHVISGDSNPTNWGLRPGGSQVLFDWERFTLAAPAIDLAITFGGTGSRAKYAALAGYYLDAAPDFTQSVEQLTDDILRAKLWIFIEFLSFYTDGILTPDNTLTWIKAEFPGWLDTLAID